MEKNYKMSNGNLVASSSSGSMGNFAAAEFSSSGSQVLSREEEELARSSVAKAFFRHRSLVDHQLHSFSEFLEYGLPAMLYEAIPLQCSPPPLPAAEKVHSNPIAAAVDGHVRNVAIHEDGGGIILPPKRRAARLLYGDVSLAKPSCIDKHRVQDKEKNVEAIVDLLPHEARLRNISYSASLFVDMCLEVYIPKLAASPGETREEEEEEEEEMVIQMRRERVCIGKVPIMVKSQFCHLHGLSDEEAAKKGHCAFDAGGYFIIKGSEKVLVAQEEKAAKRVYVSFIKKTDMWMASCAPPWKGFTSTGHFNSRLYKTCVKLVKNKGGTPILWMGLQPWISDSVPVMIILRALGICSHKELLERVCYDLCDVSLCEFVLPSIQEADDCLLSFLNKHKAAYNHEILGSGSRIGGGGAAAAASASIRSKVWVLDQNQALAYLGAKVVHNKESSCLSLVESGKRVIAKLLAHLEGGETQKSYFLGYMMNQVCCASMGRRLEDDKDSFSTKRLDLAGQLLCHQFRKAMAHLQHDIQKRVGKFLGRDDAEELSSIKHFVNEAVLTKNLQAAFALGNWNTNEGLKCSGVVGNLKRMNPMATLSHLRQIRLNVPAPLKPTDAARHPNFSYWGRICPVQTSDGAECGLVKNIALTCIVSSDSAEDPVLQVLNDFGMQNLEEISPCTVARAEKVFVNDTWVGILQDGSEATVHTLKQLRRAQLLNEQVEIVRDLKQKELRVHTDAGRLLRPLLIVEGQHLVIGKHHLKTLKSMWRQESASASLCWNYLLQQGVVELLSTEEEEGAMIALNQDDLEKSRTDPEYGGSGIIYTHLEIDASYLLGLGATMIPFLEHNQASRNLYQADKHCKQAIGFYTTNFWGRSDSSAHHLFYPQKPIVTTCVADNFLKKPEFNNGQVAIVSIQCLAYNQEDSIVMNQASIDRGLFRSLHFKTYRGEERQNVDEHFGKPSVSDDLRTWYKHSLQKIEQDGFPQIGEWLEKGEIVIGKITAEKGNAKLVDTSQRLKVHEQGRVDQVLLATEEDGHHIAKVRLCFDRAPQAGDKFSSMHGQKGVVGATFKQEDLPFTQQGIVPDIVINPHAFPSRQTVGQVLECMLGKVVALSGTWHNATPFSNTNTGYSIMEQLHTCQFQRGGCESMCSGTTGKQLKEPITIGVTFYQRLNHMAQDKIKCRGQGGPVNVLTRQPVKSRKCMGGVKFGEMERDCMLGHGASATLWERYFLLSDPYRMHICSNCQRPATMDKTRTSLCHFCKTRKHVVQINIPYACKLLWQELHSMGISIYMNTKL